MAAGVLEFKDDIFINTDVSAMKYSGEQPFKIRRFIESMVQEKFRGLRI